MPGLHTVVICSLFLIGLLSLGHAHHHDQGEEDFLKSCPPSTCGSIPVRFPFRLQSSAPFCGAPGLNLTCDANHTLLLSLLLPDDLPPLAVTAINYLSPNYTPTSKGFTSQLTVRLGPGFGSLSSGCPLQNLSSFDFLSTPIYEPSTAKFSLLNCSKKFTPGPGLAGPVSCLSGSGNFVYVVSADAPMYVIPDGCTVSRTGGAIPVGPHAELEAQFYTKLYYEAIEFDYAAFQSFGNSVESFEERREVNLTWQTPRIYCDICELHNDYCGLNLKTNQTFCYKHHHSQTKTLVLGTSCGGLLVISVLFLVFYVYRKYQKKKEAYLRIERFLATYKTTKPQRYSFSEIKKITKRFRHKLGQGGFGSVYKGELSSGIPVAVKMLEKSKEDRKEFINEVATIGRIHHVNVVRLLGFCSEGENHALVYEFMANGSLEKIIFFNDEAKSSRQPFTTEKLLEVAIAIAQGIKYLHQGCDQRILHFDIKPHNILLDTNFNPKISDFGLAKLCSREQSIITMTAARGTVGYIAPEIYSRNFGTVSYKSDVYSFGMLLLEMVSGKRTVDPNINKNQNEVYFPEWIYGQLIAGENVSLAIDKEDEENIVKKLVIVALWCIQWNPINRPAMSRVVQLLKGNIESLQIPPKPFISSNSD